jgi:hypothetical protein
MPALLWTLILASVVAGSIGQAAGDDRLVVYGSGFSFGVKEPAGWQGDTKNARSIEGNVLFCKKGESLQRFSALIYVRVNDKVDEDLSADLMADIKGYKQEHRDAEFRDMTATHPSYQVFPKVFVIPGKSFEYVAYVNPGQGKRVMFSVAMNVPKREATADELAAYQAVLASLVLLNPNALHPTAAEGS